MMLVYTGIYKGNHVYEQGSGISIPSALIYYHELINDYDVKNLSLLNNISSTNGYKMI